MSGFESFTVRAKSGLVNSQKIAFGLKHPYIAPEHLLLGILQQEDCVAVMTLRALGIDMEDLLSTLREGLHPASHMTATEIKLTLMGREVFESAVHEALQLNHCYIGTEHILLGLLRQEQTDAAQILQRYGVELEQTRAKAAELSPW